MKGTALPPEYVLLLFQFLLVVVIAIIAWLGKRTVNGIDESMKALDGSVRVVSQQVNDLKVLIAGDLYPRKEHMEYARHVDEQMNMIRKAVHDIRDQAQVISNRVTILEAFHRKE